MYNMQLYSLKTFTQYQSAEKCRFYYTLRYSVMFLKNVIDLRVWVLGRGQLATEPLSSRLKICSITKIDLPIKI